MKKLVCAADIRALSDQKKKVLYVEDGMIITPAAKDEAKLLGIELSLNPAPCEPEPHPCAPEMEPDSAVIYQVLKAMAAKGLLEGLLHSAPGVPFTAETDPSGLKLVRGGSVIYDNFDTGAPGCKVRYQELISQKDSSMSAGFLLIEDNSRFEWELFYEEIDVVLEGTLTVTLNGKTFVAREGDVLYVPKGSKVIWGADGCAKLFYVTYPANWPDLMPQQ